MRNRVITIRLNDEEYDRVRNDSIQCGLKMEPYIRCLIMNKELRSRPPVEWGGLVHHVAKIGNTINQIARVANANRYISAESVADIQRMQMAIWHRVRNM